MTLLVDVVILVSFLSVARMSYETRLMGTGNETCMHSLVNRPEFRTWENPVPAYVYGNRLVLSLKVPIEHRTHPLSVICKNGNKGEG